MAKVSYSNNIKANNQNIGYIYILPVLLFILGLIFYPLIRGFWFSLNDIGITNKGEFVGLANYIDVLTDDEFYESIWRTVKFASLVVTGHFVLGFSLSNLLNKDFRGVMIYRAILILPWIIPESIIAMIFKWILNPLYGLLNNYLLMWGIISEPTSWLGSSDTAFIAVVVACIWKGFPLIMVMLLAGLQSVNQDMYEAADIDGASEWQKFLFITIPSMRNVIFTALILDIMWWFKHFTIIWVFTQGGPGSATAVISIEIYKNSFKYFELGKGAAIAVIVFLIIFTAKTLLERGFKLNESS